MKGNNYEKNNKDNFGFGYYFNNNSLFSKFLLYYPE